MGEDEQSRKHQLEALNQHLDEVKKMQPAALPEKPLPGDSARIAIDFASATTVGTVIGFAFDRWQHTLPWGLLVGLLVGTAAGLKMMLQANAQMQKPEEKNETKNAQE